MSPTLHSWRTGLRLHRSLVDDRGDHASSGTRVAGGWTGHRCPCWHDAGCGHGLGKSSSGRSRGRWHDRTRRQWCLYGTRGWVGDRLRWNGLLGSPRLRIDRRCVRWCVGVGTLAVVGTTGTDGRHGQTDHQPTNCPRKKPSMALARECGRTQVHLGNPQKRRGFSGLPVATSCGGRLYPQSAKREHSDKHHLFPAGARLC